MWRGFRVGVLGLFCLSLLACGNEPPPRPVVRETAPARDLVAEVRAAAADAGDVIDVAPLRDPAVEDLLQAAERATQERAWGQADAALKAALEYSPDDPEILQRQAETRLGLRALEEAEQLAARSYELGPRLGALCRRNWATVQLARSERGDTEGAARAAAQRQRCVLEPPVRM